MSVPQGTNQDRKTRLINLALVGIVGQVGFLTLLIILIALFAGLWLDGRMHTRPVFTLVFLVASIPVSLLIMFVIVRLGVARIKPGLVKSDNSKKKETNFGEDT